MDSLRLSKKDIKDFISFAFSDKVTLGKGWSSTELARKLLQAYIRTTRVDESFNLPRVAFIESLRECGFKANFLFCNVSKFDVRILKAVNNITMEPGLANRIQNDPYFLLFVCNSVRQYIESEPAYNELEIINRAGKAIKAFIFRGELFSLTLFHDQLLIKSERIIN